MTAAATALTRFAHDFGIPFLLGQKCTVGDFVGEEGHRGISHGLGLVPELQDALERQYVDAALFTGLTPGPFDEDAGTLLYAAHELFAACHPQSGSFYARSHSFCEVAADKVSRLPRTLDPAVLLTRHLVVRRVFMASRTDVHLKWWTGAASFYGDEPPPRLMAWPGIRRVKVERLQSPMWKLCKTEGDEETRVARMNLLQLLLDISPLTRLVLLGDEVQKELPFSLMLPYKVGGKSASPLYLLESRDIARSVTDALLQRGAERAGAMLALAVLAALREGSSPYALRRGAEFAAHLFLMMCLVESVAPQSPETAPLRELLSGPDGPAAKTDAARVFYALVEAVFSLGDQGGLPVPAQSDLSREATQILTASRRVLGTEPFQVIAGPLARELARRLQGAGAPKAAAAQ